MCYLKVVFDCVSFKKAFSTSQTIMTVRYGGSVTNCVKTVLGITTAAVPMDTS